MFQVVYKQSLSLSSFKEGITITYMDGIYLILVIGEESNYDSYAQKMEKKFEVIFINKEDRYSLNWKCRRCNGQLPW